MKPFLDFQQPGIRARFRTTCLAGFLGLTGMASATLLLEDDFESYTVGGSASGGVWNTVSTGPTIANNGTQPFGSPNQYLSWDDSGSGSWRIQSPNQASLAGAVSTFSFDFLEPDNGLSSVFWFGFSTAGADLNTAGQAIRVGIDDGRFVWNSLQDEVGTVDFPLDTRFRVHLVMNDSASPVPNYLQGQTLDAGEADLWVALGGAVTFVGSAIRDVNGAPSRASFRSYSTDVQTVYIDNVRLETGIHIVPEPTSFSLALLGSLWLGRILRRP